MSALVNAFFGFKTVLTDKQFILFEVSLQVCWMQVLTKEYQSGINECPAKSDL